MTWIPCLIISAAVACSASAPFTHTSPLSGCSTPEMILMRVDLPEPFSPMRQCASPERTEKSTPFRAYAPTKLLWMALSRRKSSMVRHLLLHRVQAAKWDHDQITEWAPAHASEPGRGRAETMIRKCCTCRDYPW